MDKITAELERANRQALVKWLRKQLEELKVVNTPEQALNYYKLVNVAETALDELEKSA